MVKRSHPTKAEFAMGGSRRSVLKAIGLAGAMCPFSSLAFAETREEGPVKSSASGHITDAPLANAASADDRVPFYGPHQAGITTARPANGMIASFDVVADTPDELERLFRSLTERIAFLTQGGAVPDVDPRLPPPDSGIVGPVVRPDALTVTLSVGASLFEDRTWLKSLKPKQLVQMMRFHNDALDRQICHGDLALQVCGNTQDTTIHALRDIIKNCPGQLILKWKQEGNVPVIVPEQDGTVQSARNFLGFHDGSANPDAGDVDLMKRLVWADAGRGEPGWVTGGSYQVVRIIRNFVERWDRTPLGEQERIMGRVKKSGAPLDNRDSHEFLAPNYKDDPDGKLTPIDAHIRLANPRTEETRDSLILRRPFNYSNGVTRSGQLDQGLLFICYQADLDQGFISVQRRLDGEPLEEYIKPVGGGFFYALPGVRSDGDFLGSSLVAAARATASRPLLR